MKTIELLTTTDFQALVNSKGIESITKEDVEKELAYELAYGLFKYEVPEKFKAVHKWIYNNKNKRLIVTYEPS